MSIRGLAAALNAHGRFKYKPPEHVVDHLVIGGGIVGLAIAERLSVLNPSKTTYLVERHERAGEETSSRNSEVIHAGIYYPQESLKTRLCVLGRQRLYQRCLEHKIPHKRLGKLIVARNHQREYLDRMVVKARSLSSSSDGTPVPVELISGEEAREMQPDLSLDIAFALHSPETGIVDSHALMESFEKVTEESGAGELVYSTEVVRVDPFKANRIPTRDRPDGTAEGWVVQTVTSPRSNRSEEAQPRTEGDALLARVLINASGLNANLVLNSLLPRTLAIPMYYARGSYASYRGPGVTHVSKLIYPVPDTIGERADDSFKFQSLGNHLTLDMDGNVRFGPDIEWLSPPTVAVSNNDTVVLEEGAVDFWTRHLVADDSVGKLEAMHQAITTYLPGITLGGLRTDYVGIRPKLIGPDGGFRDFQVRIDRARDFGGSSDALMVSLLGIESPGLTASMGIAEHVVNFVHKYQ